MVVYLQNGLTPLIDLRTRSVKDSQKLIYLLFTLKGAVVLVLVVISEVVR